MVGHVKYLPDFRDFTPDNGLYASPEREIGCAAALATAAHPYIRDIIPDIKKLDKAGMSRYARIDVVVQ